MDEPKFPAGYRKQYDDSHEVSYGYFACESCGSKFYVGGDALHNKNCPTPGYTNALIWHYGPNNEDRDWQRIYGLMGTGF